MAAPGEGIPVQPDGNSVPQSGCIQGAFVRYQRRLAYTLVLACLRMYESPSVLRTRAPVGEEGGCADGVVRGRSDKLAVSVGARVRDARRDDVKDLTVQA